MAHMIMFPAKTHAVDFASIAGESARPNFASIVADSRKSHLKSFFASYDSSLENYADHFVDEADRLNLDWKLVAAIAGVESTFCKHIPYDSNNCWGWGIFTGQQDGIHFITLKAGITTVSEGLRYNYMDKGAKTIDAIGYRYAASPTWSQKVKFFINKITEYSAKTTKDLAITI